MNLPLPFFRRRAVAPADLPPLTNLPATLTPGRPPLPVRRPMATPADLARAAGDLAATQLAGDNAEQHTVPPAARPLRATGARATVRVTYTGTGIPPLTVHQATRAELAAAIAQHVRPYLGVVRAVVDATEPHVLLRAYDLTVGTATLTTLPTTGGNR